MSEPASSPSDTAPPGRRFDQVGLAVADLEAATRWWCDALDLVVDIEGAVAPLSLRFVMLRAADGFRVELLHREGSAPPDRTASHPADAALVQTYGHVALEVADLDGTYAHLLEKGATSVLPPGPAPVPGRMAWVTDAEGNLIKLLNRRRRSRLRLSNPSARTETANRPPTLGQPRTRGGRGLHARATGSGRGSARCLSPADCGSRGRGRSRRRSRPYGW